MNWLVFFGVLLCPLVGIASVILWIRIVEFFSLLIFKKSIDEINLTISTFMVVSPALLVLATVLGLSN